MANNPKLEVYQVWLNPNKNQDKTFRDFIIDTISSEEEEDSVLFLDFFTEFIKGVDSEEFIANNKKKKAFTAYDTSPGLSDPTITPHSTRNIIEGVIEGGRFGQKRNKSSMENKSEKEDIYDSDIILDKFYFLLYTPFDSGLGILFLQCYSTDTISDIFTDFIGKLFSEKGMYKKSTVSKFVPRRIVEDFKDHSNIKRFSFSSRFVFDHYGDQSIAQQEEEFIIKIEAVSPDGLSKRSLPLWIEAIGSKVFNQRQLSDFKNGKVYLKNEKTDKESPFDIDSDLEVKPVIYLEGKIDIGIDGLPDFGQLSKYCIGLLDDEIIPEMFVTNEVQER